MSDARDADRDDELEAIRERKRAELRRKLEGEALEDGTADGDDDPTAASTPTEPVEVEGATHLEELVADGGAVLVDFHAEWCGPCSQLEPTVDRLAAETAATVAKVDVDAHGQLAARHGVRGVPTLLLFADGEPVERVVGVRGFDALAGLIERHAA